MYGDGLISKSYLTLVTPWTVAHQAPPSMGFEHYLVYILAMKL